MLNKFYIRNFIAKILSLLIIIYPTVIFANEELSIIRDAEIEETIELIAKPIIAASGLKNKITFALINDPNINAFATQGNKIFLHTGLIAKCDTPEMLAGVIAHELGHILAGHVISRKEYTAANQMLALATTLVGLVTMMQNSEIGGAIAMGGMHIAERSYLNFSRTQENMADQSAIKLLNDAHINTQGLSDILKKIYYQERIINSKNSYSYTHPLSMERINIVKNNISKKYDPINSYRFKLAKAKLEGYLAENRGRTLLNKIQNQHDEFNLYKKVIIYFRQNNFDQAKQILLTLINNDPQFSYFYELLAQINFSQNDYQDFIKNYSKALSLSNNKFLLYSEYANFLLAAYEKNFNTEYLKIGLESLNQALKYEENSYYVYYNLARAYGLKKDQLNTNYYLAKSYEVIGDLSRAKYFAENAKKYVGKNSVMLLKLNDLIK